MLITVGCNGKVSKSWIVCASPEQLPRLSERLKDVSYDISPRVETLLQKTQKMLGATGIGAALTDGATRVAMAAGVPSTSGLDEATRPLWSMLQDLAEPVGIGIAMWGLIELMIGNPAGKQKVKMAIVCYIGIFIIPMAFYAIHNAFTHHVS